LVLHGGLSSKLRRETCAALQELPQDQERLLVATGRFLGEGFDDPRLDTLFLTLPISWRGTLAQYVGRLHRIHDGKREVQVYDYLDAVPTLERMYQKRRRGYRALGYELVDPGEASNQG
jgi:superfamily II DNA or RNA helicase